MGINSKSILAINKRDQSKNVDMKQGHLVTLNKRESKTK